MPPKGKKKNKNKAVIEAELKAREEEEERFRIQEENNRRQRCLEIEKQQKIRAKIQNEIFQKDQEEMDKLVAQWQLLYHEEKMKYDCEQEWKDHLSCDDDYQFNQNVEHYVNCFLYEQHLDIDNATADDLCQFCDDVGSLVTKLKCKSISTTIHSNPTVSQDGAKSKLCMFTIDSIKLLQLKADIITSRYIKQHLERCKVGSSTGDETPLISRGKRSSFNVVHCLPNNEDTTFNHSYKAQVDGANISFKASQLAGKGAILRVMKVPFHKVGENSDGLPLIINDTTYHISLITLPLSPKQVDKWTVDTKKTSCINMLTVPVNIECSFPISTFMVASNSLAVLRYDDVMDTWSDKGISDVRFDFGQKRFNFNINQPESIVAIALTNAVPYKKWSIKPMLRVSSECRNNSNDNDSVVELSLETHHYKIRIHVCRDHCYLLEPIIPQTNDLVHKPLHPESLLIALCQRGFYLIPNKMDYPLLKDLPMLTARNIFEDRFCHDMSMLCFAFDISSLCQRGNHEDSIETFTYNITESDVFTGCNNVLPMHQMKMMLVENNDQDREVGDVERDDSMVSHTLVDQNMQYNSATTDDRDRTHLYPLFSLRSFCTSEAYHKVEGSSPLTRKTMKRLIDLVKPMSFCSID
jgi:hypothetical protein